MAFHNAQNIDASGSTFNDVQGNQSNIMNVFNSAFQIHQQSMASINLNVGSSVVPLPVQNIIQSRDPPAYIPIFGRDEFVAKAVHLIQTAQPARLAILGPGGIGKTSTALAILHHKEIVHQFHGKCYFVHCESIQNGASLVFNILHILGVQDVSGDPLDILKRHLKGSVPLLLVLDNFETPWENTKPQVEVEQILQHIASMQHVTLIVTMRGTITPSGIAWTQPEAFPPLSGLSLEAACQAFTAEAGKSQPDGDLNMLLQALDCVPLAIKLVANVAKSQKCTCKVLLERWGEKKTAMLKTRSKSQGQLESIEVSIYLSVQSIAHEPESVQLLSLIAHLPDGVLEWTKRLQEIAPQFDDLESAVIMLLDFALAYNAKGTLKLLSPIRHYVLEKYPAEPEHVIAMEKYYWKMISLYAVSSYGLEHKEAMKNLLPEAGNISSVIKDASNERVNEDVVNAAIAMTEFTFLVQPSVELISLVMPFVERDLKSLQPNCNKLMGEILAMQSKYTEAAEKLEKGQAQFTQIGNLQGATKCLQSLGNILRMQCKYTEAGQKLEDAQKQFTQSGKLLEATWCLQSLGEILRMQSNYTEAAEKLEQAQAQFTKVGDLLGVPWCLWALGMILYDQAKYMEAAKKLVKAQAQFTQIGDLLGATKCLKTLGDFLRMQCMYAEAAEKLEKAQAQFTQMGNLQGATECLQSLGEILRMQSKYTEAVEKLEAAQAQFTQIGDLLGVPWCLWALGMILYDQAKYIEAAEKLGMAQAQFTQIGNLLGATQCLQSLGNVLYMQSKYTEAAEKLEKAQAQFTQMGNVQGATQCLQSLGNIFYKQSKYTEAAKKLKKAQVQFTLIGDHIRASQCHGILNSIYANINDTTSAL